MKTLKTYTKTFFSNWILKNNSVKTAFIPLLRASEENTKSNGRHKGSCWTLIIFSSTALNFEDFVQTMLFIKWIKVQILLVQSLGFNAQSSQLSTINYVSIYLSVYHYVHHSHMCSWMQPIQSLYQELYSVDLIMTKQYAASCS